MVFTFPNTGQEFLTMLAPLVTVLLGLSFLLFPGRMLNTMGLRAKPDRPEAIGEGRSSFAGPLVAIGLSCLLLQEPVALQPGLNLVLALAWTVAAIGRLIQIAFDGGWRKRIQIRFLLAALMAGLAWQFVELPTFSCFEVSLANCHSFDRTIDIVLYGTALLTLGLGLVSFLLPKLALRILRLESRMRYPFGVGEPRGMLAGCYIALGAVVLLKPQPVDFVALMLAAAWILTGLGRAISMVLDRGFTLYNLLGTVFECAIGGLILALMFGLV